MVGGDWKEMFRGVETNDIGLVKYYLSKGIDVNYQHPEFLTSALIESIRQNHHEMLEYLLQNGADPELKEAFSYHSPWQIAQEMNNKTAQEILNRYLTHKGIVNVKKSKTFLQKYIYPFYK